MKPLRTLQLLLRLFEFDFFQKRALQRSLIQKLGANTNSPKQGFRLVYFTCKKHFHLLELSLQSIRSTRVPNLRTIHIYVDRNDPFTADQRARIAKTPLPISLRTTNYSMAWGGVEVILNELTAFAEIAREGSPADYIVKVDSDFLFLKSAVFTKVNRIKPAFSGQKWGPYIQGGCYFIRSACVVLLLSQSLSWTVLRTIFYFRRHVPALRIGLSNCPEDCAISFLVKSTGSPITHMDFVVNCSTLKTLPTAAIKSGGISAMHFDTPQLKEMMAATWSALRRSQGKKKLNARAA